MQCGPEENSTIELWWGNLHDVLQMKHSKDEAENKTENKSGLDHKAQLSSTAKAKGS